MVIGDGMDGRRDDGREPLDDLSPRDANTAMATKSEGIAIDLPVPDGETDAHAKAVVEEMISKKGWNPVRQDTYRVKRR